MKTLLLVMLGLFASSVFAADPMVFENVWVRTTTPGQEVGAAYMDITSSIDATLVKIETPVAAAVEIHSMSMHNGIMKMRMMEDGLPLPAGKTVRLAPGGFHLMLFGLKKPLKAGDRITLILSAKSRSGKTFTQQLSAPVKTN